MRIAPHGKGDVGINADVIAADVLDAWFLPSPAVIAAYGEAARLIGSSPDPECRPLIEAIARAKGLPKEAISLGAGSSEIIHRVLPALAPGGKVVLLDPTYSEYGFLLEQSGCEIVRLALDPLDNLEVSVDKLVALCTESQGARARSRALGQSARQASPSRSELGPAARRASPSRGGPASVVILVNPNNPTGRVLSAEQVMDLRAMLSSDTILWVDEAYIDYAPEGCTVEKYAAVTPNLFVLKSLSKAYALSGLRAAYLVSRTPTSPPPWIVGHPAQMAAIAALGDPDYYTAMWRETNRMTEDFAAEVSRLGFSCHHGFLNAVLVEDIDSLSAEWLAEQGLIVRTPEGMGDVLSARYIRIGVKPRHFWPRMLAALEQLHSSRSSDKIG